ncbi:hypothetical protein I4F81_004498 [Pyropia yezoensis]|uniref:Uncharacterized protein n=1 Tax=Pyropia yezoensis TaxID=2788 RepID=A0ACC3BVZ2_PYRYE|nr:hypothetical protein I4F81_004498 [Neopyropia yezoensis]
MMRGGGAPRSCCPVVARGAAGVLWVYNGVEIIANHQGNRTTPSFVAFTSTKRLAGYAAKNQVAVNAANTVYDVKWLIGRHFSEPSVQRDLQHFSYLVVAEDGDMLFVQIECQVSTTQFVVDATATQHHHQSLGGCRVGDIPGRIPGDVPSGVPGGMAGGLCSMLGDMSGGMPGGKAGGMVCGAACRVADPSASDSNMTMEDNDWRVALATPGGGLSPTSGGGGGGAGGGGTTTPATALLRTVLATAEAARSAWAGPVPLVTAAAADTRALVAAVTAAADADLDAHRGSLDTARAYYAVTVLIDVLGCLAGGPSPPAAPVGGGGGGHATASPAAGGAAAGCPAAGAPADDGATADRARYAVAHIMKALADGGPAADGTVGPPPASAWAACRSAAAAAAAPGAAAVAAALAADATVEPPALTAAADALARHRGGGGAGGAPPSSPPSSSPPSSPATPAAAAAAGAGASLLTAARATKKAASALDFGDAPAARRCLRAALRALDGVGRGPADGVGG